MEVKEVLPQQNNFRGPNVYEGEEGLFAFLHPETAPITPLVELPARLNPHRAEGVRLWAKMLNLHPLLNNKAIPATEMLEGLFLQAGLRVKEKKLVESSSLNLASALGLIGRHFGIRTTRALVDDDIAPGLVKCFRLFGIEVEFCPSTEEDGTPAPTRVQVAQKRAQSDDDWINLNQYANENNPLSHVKVTGPQLYSQTQGRIDIWCASLGTSGTMIGNARFLKQLIPTLRCLGVVRAPNTYTPGPRTLELLGEVAFPWQRYVDSVVEVTPEEAYTTSLHLVRQGILAGPSSGLTYRGLLKALEAGFHRKDSLKVPGEDIHVVFPICDTPFVHIDNYFEFVDPKEFPETVNLRKWKKRELCRVCRKW